MISKKTVKFIDLARAASQLSTHQHFKIGAVLANGSSILATGVNQEKSHPLQKKYNRARGTKATEWSYLHAELTALLKVKDKSLLVGSTIYVSRSFKSGGNALARPCEACLDALIDHGVKMIVYTTEHGIAEEYVIPRNT